MNKTKKILIVGGTGFIGYHLAKESLKKKWEVTSISSHKVKNKRSLTKVSYIYCDISKKNSLKKIQNENPSRDLDAMIIFFHKINLL